MLIIWGLQTQSYPASLIAILAVFGIVVGFGIDTKLVILLLFKVVFHLSHTIYHSIWKP
jgi:hypothetical protein